MSSKIFGLDVHPAFQPWMDFGKLADEPNWDMRFAIVKATEGYGYKAPRYNEYITGIKGASLVAGSYHYFYAADGDTKWEAERQAEYFVNNARETRLPLILDLEDRLSLSFQKAEDKNAGTTARGALYCLAKIEELTGRTPILYTGDWYMDLIPYDQEFLKYPLWVASYPSPDVLNPGFIPYLPDEWILTHTEWYMHQFSTKYRNMSVAQSGYWDAVFKEWRKLPWAVNCDMNRTTEDKLNYLIGEDTTPPPLPPVPTPEKTYEDAKVEMRGFIDTMI